MSDRDELAKKLCDHTEHMESYTLPAVKPGFIDGYMHALALVRRDAGFMFHGVLTEHDRQVRRDVAEEIAQAIEAGSVPIESSGYAQKVRDAWIAREIGERDE